jgi:hypothetical protein
MSRAKRSFDTDGDAVEALPLPSTPFPFQSKTNDENTLGSTLVLALAHENKRYAFVPNERDIL